MKGQDSFKGMPAWKGKGKGDYKGKGGKPPQQNQQQQANVAQQATSSSPPVVTERQELPMPKRVGVTMTHIGQMIGQIGTHHTMDMMNTIGIVGHHITFLLKNRP